MTRKSCLDACYIGAVVGEVFRHWLQYNSIIALCGHLLPSLLPLSPDLFPVVKKEADCTLRIHSQTSPTVPHSHRVAPCPVHTSHCLLLAFCAQGCRGLIDFGSPGCSCQRVNTRAPPCWCSPFHSDGVGLRSFVPQCHCGGLNMYRRRVTSHVAAIWPLVSSPR